MRDWTNSAADHDTGAEPSTDPVYYDRSDVWTRKTNTPGAFPNDQPENEEAFAGATNYAFARVSRNGQAATGSAPVSVTAEFFFYNLGIGSNWEPLGLETLPFGPSDLQKVSPGHAWTPPLGTSGKKCLAVQISAPGDPYRAPSLLNSGFAGIRQDNNKAQRNIHVVPLPSPGPPLPLPIRMGVHFVVHNPGLSKRTLVLRSHVDGRELEQLTDPRIAVVGGEEEPLRPDGELRLPDMQPGENRFVRLSIAAVKGVRPVAVSLSSNLETSDSRVEGGVTIAFKPTPLQAVLAHNLRLQEAALRRMSALVERGGVQPTAAVETDPPDVERYRRRLKRDLPRLEEWTSALLGAKDAFSVREHLASVRGLLSGSEWGLAVAHASWLDHLDSSLTARDLDRGDPADIGQNVRWQLALLNRLGPLARKGDVAAIADWSTEFLAAASKGASTAREYSLFFDQIRPGLQALAEAAPQLGFAADLDRMKASVGSAAALQKAHRGFLLKLETLAELEKQGIATVRDE